MNPSRPAPAEPPTESEAGKPARILIVDDVPANLNVLGDALEPEGYEILAARSGEAALESARTNRPDLILLDVMMPGMDGGDLAQCFQASPKLRSVPVVFLTAAVTRAEVSSRGGRIGGLPFLAKPVDMPELIGCLEKHLCTP